MRTPSSPHEVHYGKRFERDFVNISRMTPRRYGEFLDMKRLVCKRLFNEFRVKKMVAMETWSRSMYFFSERFLSRSQGIVTKIMPMCAS